MELVLLGTALLGGLLLTLGARSRQVSTRIAGQFFLVISLVGLVALYGMAYYYGSMYR